MEVMLLNLWEEKIEELRGSRKNSHVYQEIAEKMQQSGFFGTWTDIRTKIDNLTRKYKQERSKIGTTGGTPSIWVHYNSIHNILGAFKLHNIQSAMHESTDFSTLIDDIIEIDADTTCSSQYTDYERKPVKKKKMDSNAELLRLAQERLDMQRQQQLERKEQVSEMLKRLDTISSQNAAFQTQLLNILRNKM